MAGEAQAQEEALLPIDLHYDKLTDWLVDRKKVPETWRKNLKALHSKWRQLVDEPSSESESESNQGQRKEEVKRMKESLLLVRGDLPDEQSGGGGNGYVLLSALREKLIKDLETTARERERGFGDTATTTTSRGGGGGKSLLSSLGMGIGMGGTRYTGALGELDKLLKVYEKSHLDLAENAQYLVQSTDYEIPALCAKVQRLLQQMSDAHKREEEYAKTKQSCAKNFKQACSAWGLEMQDVVQAVAVALAVEGKNSSSKRSLAKKLCRNLSQLPPIFDQCVREMNSDMVKECFRYYKAFVNVTVQRQQGSTSSSSPGCAADDHGASLGLGALESLFMAEEEEEVVTLQSAYEMLLRENNMLGGNVSIQDQEKGATLDDKEKGEEREEEVVHEISWDIDMDLSEEAAGAEGESGAGTKEEPTLNWDIDMSDQGVGDSGVSPGEPTISWDIDVSAGGEDGFESDVHCVNEGDRVAFTCGGGGGDQAASGGGLHHHAADLLEDGERTLLSSSTKLFSHSFKSQVLDDLYELSAFLSQRLLEGESQSDVGMFISFQGGSAGGDDREAEESSLLQSTSTETIKLQMDKVNFLIRELTSKEVGRLDLLRSSRSLQKIIRQLEQKQAQEGKYESMIQGVKSRREDLQRQSTMLKPKLKALVSHTQRIKSAIENAISKQYGDRPVHVIGQVNTVLLEATTF